MSQGQLKEEERKGFGKTIRDDIKEDDFFKKMKNELKELVDFFTSEERKIKLRKVGKFKRFFLSIMYLLEALFYKLTTPRRIMVVIGFILFVSGHETNGGNAKLTIGSIILLILILLELKDKLVAQFELQDGHQVQQALLPESNPQIEGWDVWLYTQSANEVGGDLIDCLKMDGNKYGLSLGDVSGKGLKAALLMAKLQATIRALATEFNSISEFASRLNKIFHRDIPHNFFASLVYLEIDTSSPKVQILNAGHLPPIILRTSSIEILPKGNPALGLMKNVNYDTHEIVLHKDEMLVVYSDGLTEARNENGEFFGHEKLIELVVNLNKLSSEEAAKFMENKIKEYQGGIRLTDDLSFIILKRIV